MRNKIGFHCGPGGNPTGIGDYMRALDAARIPFFLKSVDHYGPIFEAQNIMKASGVPHVLVFRLSNRHDTGEMFDTPNYNTTPEAAATAHWQMTKAKLPPEMDRERVWLEVINEVDRNLCNWLGWFGVAIANLAHADGYKVSLFSWAGGEPEPQGWEEPGMLAYLQLCANKPGQTAVALHEYSFAGGFLKSRIAAPGKFEPAELFSDGRLIGRFRELFGVCDRHGIARPTVHITEFGWALNHLPTPETAVTQLDEASQLYAQYPEVQGAAIWYLGAWDNDMPNKTQKLIQPVTDYTLNTEHDTILPAPGLHYLPGGGFELTYPGSTQPPVDPPEGEIVQIETTEYPKVLLDGWANREVSNVWLRWSHNDGAANVFTDWQPIELPAGLDLRGVQVRARTRQVVTVEQGGESRPPQQYARVVHVVPPDAAPEEAEEIINTATSARQTITYSYDDAGYAPGFESNTAVLWNIIPSIQPDFVSWYAERYPNTTVEFRETDPKAVSPLDGLELGQLFNVPYVQTSPFDAVRDYGKHEGADFDVIGTNPNSKEMVLCVYDGTVERSLDSTGGYGKYVRVVHERNGRQFYTRYCHLDTRLVQVGQAIKAGQPVGEIGTTGNVSGEHVHFNLEVPGFGLSGYVVADVVDPVPYLPKPITQPPPGGGYTGPAVTFISGVDQPASDWYWHEGYKVFETTKLAPKFHAGGTNHVWWDTFKHPAFNLVRVLLSPTFKGNAQDIFNETTAAVAQFYARGARDFELLNEPNIEGMGVRWNNGIEFGLIFRSLCLIYKSAYPAMRIWFPGMSPGFGAQHAFIADAASVGAFDYIYGMSEHVYTGIANNAQAASDQMVAEVKDFQKRWALTRPLAITEFSVNRPATGAYKADVYKKFYATLATVPGIQAAYSFTATWHPSADENKEGWLENGIHTSFVG